MQTLHATIKVQDGIDLEVVKREIVTAVSPYFGMVWWFAIPDEQAPPPAHVPPGGHPPKPTPEAAPAPPRWPFTPGWGFGPCIRCDVLTTVLDGLCKSCREEGTP